MYDQTMKPFIVTSIAEKIQYAMSEIVIMQNRHFMLYGHRNFAPTSMKIKEMIAVIETACLECIDIRIKFTHGLQD